MPGMPTSEAEATESSRSVKLSRPSFTEAKRNETPEARDADRAGDDRLVISRERAADADEERGASDLDQQRRLRATQAATRDRLLRDMRRTGRGDEAGDREARGEGDIESGRVRRRQRHARRQAEDAEVERARHWSTSTAPDVRSETNRSMPGIPTSEADATESSRSVKLSRPSFTDAKRSETPEAEMPTVPATTDLWSALSEPPTPTNSEAPVISTSSAVCAPLRAATGDLCFETCAEPAAETKPAIERPAVKDDIERGRVRRRQRHREGEAEDAEVERGDTGRGRLHQRQIADEQVDAGDPDERRRWRPRARGR